MAQVSTVCGPELSSEENVQFMPHEEIIKLNAKKLRLAADHYSNVSPAVSRFYMDAVGGLLTETDNVAPRTRDVCIHCGQVFRPGNHTKTLKPKMKRTKKIRQLEKKSKMKKLSKYQTQLLEAYTKALNYILMKCKKCGKVTKIGVYARVAKDLSDKHTSDHAKLSKKQKKKLKAKMRKEQTQSSSLVTYPNTSKKGMLQRTVANPAPHKSMREIMRVPKYGKAKDKAKSAFNRLQEILNQEQEEMKKKSDQSLAAFLSSV